MLSRYQILEFVPANILWIISTWQFNLVALYQLVALLKAYLRPKYSWRPAVLCSYELRLNLHLYVCKCNLLVPFSFDFATVRFCRRPPLPFAHWQFFRLKYLVIIGGEAQLVNLFQLALRHLVFWKYCCKTFIWLLLILPIIPLEHFLP